MSQYDCRQQQVSIDRTPTADAIRNMHDVFLDPYRCAILHYLQEADGPVSLRDVAATIDEWRPNRDDDGDRLQASIRDGHVLPMAEFGILVYDPDTDVVGLSDDVSFSVSRPVEWTE